MTATLPIQANYKEFNAVALLLSVGATPLYPKNITNAPFEILERERSLELPTSTLARLRSTN